MSDRICPHPAKIYESGEWPSLAKAPVLGTGDREFESPLPDNYISAPGGAKLHLRPWRSEAPKKSTLAPARVFFFFGGRLLAAGFGDGRTN